MFPLLLLMFAASAMRRQQPAQAPPPHAPPQQPARRPPPPLPAARPSTMHVVAANKSTATPAQRAAVEAAVRQAVKDALARDGTPTPPSAAIAKPANGTPAPGARTPKEAAQALRDWLASTGRFGSSSDRPDQVKAAQRDLHVADDGIVGPVTRAAAKATGVVLPAKPTAPAAAKPKKTSSALKASSRTPHDAAEQLREWLSITGRFGSKKDHPDEVKAAQRDLHVTADGIVGPKTRAAAKAAGVTLPTPTKN